MKRLYILWIGLLLAAAFTAANNPAVFGKYSSVSEVYVTDGSLREGEIYSVFEIVNGKAGESCRVDKKNFSVEECIKYFDAEIIFTEKVDGIVSLYLYSPQIKRYKTVKGERINLHVALCESYVALGSPVIYGAY